ncbi:putative signal transducing protein [Flavicella marina]|uniref:DUF2007 domain-containing protein n=1 Tax=Flavicella marina TaxID=1475951 RepID=UPI0012644087|nr:DUF2007 domain-containing protein [Flavicella marina]
MTLKTLKTFDNSFEAHLYKTKLESEGLRAYLFDENLVSLNPLYNITVGGIKLKVHEKDYRLSFDVIHKLEESKLLDENNDVVKCPICDSEELIYGFKSMRGSKGVFSIFLSLLFMVFPIYFKTVNKCKNCGFEFK